MKYVINGYEPAEAFKFFEDICAIPHGSGNERGVGEYIKAFAKERQLFCFSDDVGNVFIRKSATSGYENEPAILLQGHMDMVCEKNSDSNHDFLRDGLTLSVKDGYLWADGTTLGADNGIAVALMLALLDTTAHPMLECLFTVEEETGLTGAKCFDCSQIQAKRMINLDSEEDSYVTAGCAGGLRTEVDFRYVAKISEIKTALRISVTGLSGGHSGAEINCGKTNALVALSRILGALWEKEAFELALLSGGGKDNAIAREAFATVLVSDENGAALAIANEVFGIKKELSLQDEGFTVNIDVVDAPEKCIDSSVTAKIIAFLNTVKTGVLKMSNDIDGLVEYSRNFGVAQTDGEKVKLTFSSRSSIESQLDLSEREMNFAARLAGAECRHYSRYPGWEFAKESALRDEYVAAFKRLFGEEPTVSVIHAGLECGILSSKLGGMDIISVGPNMYDIHSPNEHLELRSCEKIWRLLLDIIRAKNASDK